MRGVRHLGAIAALALLVAGSAFVHAGAAQTAGIVPVKLGLQSMSKDDRAKLWKMVDEYATVDALEEFCGSKLNLQRRAWSAVATCVEPASMRRVFSVFRTKKTEYLKAWETLHGAPDHKKTVCEGFKTKLGEYARIISGQIAEAAKMCGNCFFC